MNSKMAQAAYIHVPFCRQKCSYCDFYSVAKSENLISAYISSLLKEITTSAPVESKNKRENLRSVYFGGGTPSILTPAQISEILELTEELYGFADDCEITLEVNPETVNETYLLALAKTGVNRLSLGLQAVQPQLLNTAGRRHSAADFVSAVKLAFAVGIEHISADVMVGLPGQTINDIDETIDLVLSLPIEHVSFYSLIIEPDTLFYEKYFRNPELLPDDDLERKMYHHVIDRLASAGMVTYEISNAATPGCESRHNLVYWQANSYYGFGPSAHSYLDRVRRANCSDIRKYISVWQNTDVPFSTATVLETIDDVSEQKEMMLLGLRLLSGVSYSDFFNRFGKDMFMVFGEQLRKLENEGLLSVGDKSVQLSKTGLDFANQVFIEFI